MILSLSRAFTVQGFYVRARADRNREHCGGLAWLGVCSVSLQTGGGGWGVTNVQTR